MAGARLCDIVAFVSMNPICTRFAAGAVHYPKDESLLTKDILYAANVCSGYDWRD